MEDLFKPDHIRTFSGKYVNIFEPKPEMFCIEDIAHALSNQCRFGGHLPEFYSVAQHSYHCAEFATPPNKLAALMHDASEAYLLDIPRPIKGKLQNYQEVEHNLMLEISKVFGFDYPMPDEVKEIDNDILQLEWDLKMIKSRSDYEHYTSVAPQVAKNRFLEFYEKLKSIK